MNRKYLSALICCSVTALCSALWLANRRNIIDLTALMGSMHTPAPAQQQENTDTPQQQQPTTVRPDAEETTPQKGDVSSPPTAPTSGKNKEANGEEPQNLGTLTVQGTEEIEHPGSDGVVRRTKITLPPEALSWTQPTRYPKEGDLLQITVPENHLFIIEVLSFEELPDGRGLVVLGGLFNGSGQANLMLHRNYFSLVISDEDHHRAYNIFYDVTNDYYVVEEIDQTLSPAPRSCPVTEGGNHTEH